MRARHGLDRDRGGLRLRQAIAAVAGKLLIGQPLVDSVPPRAAVLATIAAALITASFTGEAFAQVAATITNSFSPSTVEVGGLSIMTVTVTNPNATPLTNVQFSDTQPAGIDLITQTGGTCSTAATGGGMFSINPGTETFSSTSSVLAPGQSCNITVRVRGTLTVGAHVNTTSTVTATATPSGGPASATLTVNPVSAPTIAKAFGAAAIAVGGTTSLSFTITNPSTSTSLTGVGFTDALPAGLVVATPNGLTGSCGGGTIAATAGGSAPICQARPGRERLLHVFDQRHRNHRWHEGQHDVGGYLQRRRAAIPPPRPLRWVRQRRQPPLRFRPRSIRAPWDRL